MDPTVFSVAAVPSITGLVELAKSLGLPDRYAPLAALLFGLLAGLAQTYPHQFQWESAAIAGLGLGLAAVGAHASATTARKHSARKRADRRTVSHPTSSRTVTIRDAGTPPSTSPLPRTGEGLGEGAPGAP